MNYQKVYNSLIEKACKREHINEYSEIHHIQPKSLGGSNDQANLVRLTAREHFIAHFLLAKIYGGTQWFSIIRMRGNSGYYTNSRLYEVARNKWSVLNRNKTISVKSRQAISQKLKGKKLSNEHKSNISKGQLGKPLTIEHRQSVSNGIKAHWAKRKFLKQCIALNLLIDSVFERKTV